MMNKAVFLDRDGTINEEKYYLHRIEDFHYLDGVIEGLQKLSEDGFMLIIITNQSGIARGYYSETDYQRLTTWMLEDLKKKGIKITEVYFCPHYPQGTVKKYAVDCECRKPKTGLFWKAARDYDIDMERSFAIGDKLRDLEITAESGAKGILLSNNKDNLDKYENVRICRTFSDAVEMVLSWED